MSKLLASEKLFVKSLVSGNADKRCYLFRYGLVDYDLISIMDDIDNDTTLVQILGGMLQSKNLIPISINDLCCIPDGSLVSIDQNYINLAINCSRTFIHDTVISDDDLTTLAAEPIDVYRSDSIDFGKLSGERVVNVIDSWNLVDGGNVRPSDILCDSLHGASQVVVYDRYFGQHALQSMQELFAEYKRRHGPIKAKFDIYIGKGDGGVPINLIKAPLETFFASATLINCSKSNKTSATSLHAHDRYMQIDKSKTFTLTAGFNSFYEYSGISNRACSITLKDILIAYDFVEIVDLSTNLAVKIRY